MSIIRVNIEFQQLERISSIQYLVKFNKTLTKIQALIDFGSKINAMTPAYAAVLRLCICFTNVEV